MSADARTGAARPPIRRRVVVAADDRAVNVPRRPGHFFVCALGCCCGHAEKGIAPVRLAQYQREWEERRLRNRVHLTETACLGPCELANVALLVFGGRDIWFHGVDEPWIVHAIFDHIEAMVAADRYLPPPPALAAHAFTVFEWDTRRAETRPAEQDTEPGSVARARV